MTRVSHGITIRLISLRVRDDPGATLLGVVVAMSTIAKFILI